MKFMTNTTARFIKRLFHSIQVEKEVQLFGNKKQTPVSMKSLIETGNVSGKLPEIAEDNSEEMTKMLVQVACFLHRELPIRLAHRIIRLEESATFTKSDSIQNVCKWYKQSFSQIRSFPIPVDSEKEAAFAKLLSSINERHSYSLITMAKGAHEIRTLLCQDLDTFADHHDIQRRIDDFYLSRIGIKMLIGQYLALRTPSTDPDMIGLISKRASPCEIAQQVIADAAYMCRRTHGDAPEVTIHGRTDLHFPYVSSHISYMLLELLKNSMRATVETHGADNALPPIRIVIADGEDNEDVVIKVSDEGGGIKRSSMSRIWSYLYTTADPKILDSMLNTSDGFDTRDFDTSSPLAGLGYGLPISRNYARYFGGDLSVMSMEGYGTDSFIYLPRLGDKETAVV
mmetsp:Transcript_14608/g.21780  ORF Transcript_14608/g.21780 Transcript_14608/m.21780 type:complete len:399 (-) Transcript_14608:172-1368(-)